MPIFNWVVAVCIEAALACYYRREDAGESYSILEVVSAEKEYGPALVTGRVLKKESVSESKRKTMTGHKMLLSLG